MNDECKRCRGAGVTVGLLTASIIYCAIVENGNECPYVPADQHTHHEPFRFPNMPTIFEHSTVASLTPFTIDHENKIISIKNTNGNGFINLIDVSSKDITKK